MKLEQVKGNTWVLKGREMIPLYKLDEKWCVLLDTGLYKEREDILAALEGAGLTTAGVICTHGHIDHMGSVAFLQKEFGAQVVMPLGEAGRLMSYLSLNTNNFAFSPKTLENYRPVHGTPCLADQIILPGEDEVEFCGARFGIVHTPGHTPDHVCVMTPDNVLYLSDAVMTGKMLTKAVFPYAVGIQETLDSMEKLRTVAADKYIAAHYGVFEEVAPLVDEAIVHIKRQMLDLLDLIEDGTTPKDLTAAICAREGITARNFADLAYFESVSQIYLCYLQDQGHIEPRLVDNQIRYYRAE